MSDLSSQDSAIHERVHLAPYEPVWPELFSQKRQRLLSLFPQLLEVEHFGSTAVPGMAAKPIIDILGGVTSMKAADALFEPVLAAGYTTSREFNATLADRRWFMRSSGGRRTHHLHVVVHRGPVWAERLRFRDLLRGDTSLAHSYSQLKSALSVRFQHDREAYTDAKAEFVASALAAA
ncbi:MAG: GrpB family protein [Pseudomonadota bacterium]|nr:GrpB family protein [Pseudomonadota bacterium]